MKFKTLILAAALVAGVPLANAAGCAKGAVVGGIAGHVVGHHGLLGAAAGCVVGKHRAHKQEQLAQQQRHKLHASR